MWDQWRYIVVNGSVYGIVPKGEEMVWMRMRKVARIGGSRGGEG